MKSSKTCSAYLIHIIAEICRAAPVFNRCTGCTSPPRRFSPSTCWIAKRYPGHPIVAMPWRLVGSADHSCAVQGNVDSDCKAPFVAFSCAPLVSQLRAAPHAKKDHHISTVSGREPQLDCCFEPALVPVILSG